MEDGMRSLVIVESPSKARKISSFLPDDYVVMASVGHIRDLHKYRLSVDVSNHFMPTYEIPADKKKIVADLRKAAAKAKKIFLASDPDREGESIAWHLYEVLKDLQGEREFFRVRYNEITKTAVLAAIEHPSKIDQHLVDAQQARRIEDRLSGFKISRLTQSSVAGAKSAGRVQSVALRLIVDREDAVNAFQSTPYWVLGARLEKGIHTFDTRLAAIDGVAPRFQAYDKEIDGIPTEAEARAYVEDLAQRDFELFNVDLRTITKRPPAPFITSTLQQAAANVLGFTPEVTMRLAQSLYENGYITYMRTDGFTVSETIRESVKAEIQKRFGPECVPATPNVYGNKVRNAQEAHEPIRPTDITVAAIVDEENDAMVKLYDLIWRRFMASQMAPARLERTTLTFVPEQLPTPTKHQYRFTVSSQKPVFKGFYNVWSPNRKETDDSEEGDVVMLPVMHRGDRAKCQELMLDSKETQPPARYNEASLVKALEENGIGRPSTYASTIKTLLAREYVVSGKGHVLTPTEMGMNVTHFLLTEVPDFINIEFTAQMEEALDKIAAGESFWETEVADFYEKLTLWLTANQSRADALLELLKKITEWNPPRKSGNRITWDDEGFYKEMCTLRANKESLTKVQLKTLSNLTLRYSEQLRPEIEQFFDNVPPVVEKDEVLELFKQIEIRTETRPLSDWETKFLASIREQFDRRGTITDRQLTTLKNLLVQNQPEDHPENEAEAKALLALFDNFTQWHAPLKRGKDTRDDKSFIDSLVSQLKQRHFLSERQMSALKRVIRGYREEIPNYETIAQTYNIPEAAPRKTSTTRAPRKTKSTTTKSTRKAKTTK
ncbi:MAG: type I DNA topoisomerase [bacterium]|nr:type I DNA topoisomerase [bacterium]